MIHEVDAALRSLIETEAVPGADIEVVFDAPTKDWAGRRNAPTIDVYLYDIREDLRRRERGMINEYDGARVTARHLPPRYFKLSYLITAWTQRPEDEHRLLSTLLACFLRHDSLPRELLDGSLGDIGLPVPLSIALPPPEDRAFADVWSALGGELKPSLDVVVTVPTDSGQRYPAGPPVTEGARIGVAGVEDWPPPEERQWRGSESGRANGAGAAVSPTGSAGTTDAASTPGAKTGPGSSGVGLEVRMRRSRKGSSE